ncbi:MAG: TonB-dependent receptor plug domain-containing protein [Flavobacteriaceae bacterium]
MKRPVLLFLLLFICPVLTVQGQTATITGIILDEEQKPLPDVHITSGPFGSFSDETGFYLIQVSSDKTISVRFTHVGHKSIVLENIILTTNETFSFSPVMKTKVVQVDGVVVTPTGERSIEGITTFPPKTALNIPGANPGVENVLKLLPGVSSNNELSTQYAVRGGNYDENLVYINGIEVYRPFLIRSGQQEGLSFVNSSMVQNLEFSSGGFQSRYGDRLSSVLDITYKNPSRFGVFIEGSLLGLNGTVETISKDRSFSSVSGVRYRDNSLLLESQQTKANYNPRFTDLQTYLTWRLSNRFHLNFLGNLSQNVYRNEPITRQTNFGTIDNPQALLVFYEGQEDNTYSTEFGALKADYFVNDRLTLNFTSSLYHTVEEEYSDVIAQYELGPVNTDLESETLGELTSTRGVGTQFNRSRNDLDALIFNLGHRGKLAIDSRVIEWGLKYSNEDFRDRIREAEFIDSAGFSIRPPRPEFTNNQPLEPFTAPLVPFEGISAQNEANTNRISGFLQYSDLRKWGENDFYYNIGIRVQHWWVGGPQLSTSSHTIFSPRAQLAIKPDWKDDMLFRVSGGVYQQPPFYREMRDRNGEVQPTVKAQRSYQVVLGHEYSFTLWNRAFKLTSEAYFKDLDRVNPYTLEDVRIRYAANNNAVAYAYGADVRMNGAFVPGTESWVSLGYLKTEENIDNRGYISRPTDQRLHVGILFQDYIPAVPSLRMYLNLVYNTGLPGGSPSYADPYEFQNRLRDYRRADLGISYIFVDAENRYPENHWLYRFKELVLGFEIFNLFNNQNAITNTWVRDVDSKQQFAVPNFMTSRVLNLKFSMRF